MLQPSTAFMIRLATPEDAATIWEIYAPYVEESTVTFELDVPSVETIHDRVRAKTTAYPWFVCEWDGRVVGYAYAGPFRERAAYQWLVETSVYVDQSEQRKRVGQALYTALLDCLSVQGFRDAYAVITVPNPQSIGFLESMGFDRVAHFPTMGYKGGEWCDVEWWRRPLGNRSSDPTEPVTPNGVKDSEAWRAAIERGESVLEGSSEGSR